MAALPYMKLFPADYLADTQHLTTEEHGAYLLLLMNYWQTGKPLDNSDEKLYIVARLSRTRWKAVRESIAPFFKISKSNQWKHGRIEYELSKVLEKSQKTSYAGKESARKKKNRELARSKRKKGDEVPTDVVTDVPTDGQQIVNQAEAETEAETDNYLVQHFVGREEAFELCELLADGVEENLKAKSKNPERVKRPTVSKAWVTQMDLLIRKDGHEIEEVREIIEWSQADDFWASNIMSPAKLRKQFDQLIMRKPVLGLRAQYAAM